MGILGTIDSTGTFQVQLKQIRRIVKQPNRFVYFTLLILAPILKCNYLHVSLDVLQFFVSPLVSNFSVLF